MQSSASQKKSCSGLVTKRKGVESSRDVARDQIYRLHRDTVSKVKAASLVIAAGPDLLVLWSNFH